MSVSRKFPTGSTGRVLWNTGLWIAIGVLVLISNFGDRGYRTLDGDTLVLSPEGRISVSADAQLGGYDLCAGKTERLPAQPGEYVPTIQDALHQYCPSPADVQRAGIERPEWRFSFYAAGHATAGERRTTTTLLVAESLVILAGAFAFISLLRRLWAGPFAGGGVFWLRLCALAVAAGGVVLPILVHRFESSLLDRLAARPADTLTNFPTLEPASSLPGPAPYVIVIMLLVFAQVWQRGISLREDAEATV